VEKEKLIQREILAKIEPFLKRKEFLAIVGPRQCGKTTLLGQIKEVLARSLKVPDSRMHQFSFEDAATLREFEDDPTAFVRPLLAPHALSYIFIDEFQYAREGGKKLKLIYDTVPGAKVLVTGSSSLDLKANVGKFMVGRLITFRLHPFSFREFLEAEDPRHGRTYDAGHALLLRAVKEGEALPPVAAREDVSILSLQPLFETYCLWGGYPAVALEARREGKAAIIRDIYNNFLLRDVRGLLALATERELARMAEFLAAQAGNLTVYQNVSQAVGLDIRAVKKHLSVLEETFVIRMLAPWFRNRQKELVKNPKVYFEDTGFRNHLMSNFNPFEKRADVGALVENAVYAHLQRIFDVLGKISFWRAKSQAEVDFIVERGGELLPIEVKYTALDRPRVSRSLMSFITAYRPPLAVVLNKNFWGETKAGQCRVIFAPAYYL